MAKQEEIQHDKFDEMLINHLKTVGTDELEELIARAVTELIEVNHNCTISSIEYDESLMTQGAKIELTIKKERQL